MRSPLVLSAAMIVAAAPAAASPAEDGERVRVAVTEAEVRSAVSTLLLALDIGETSALRAMFAPVVKVTGLVFGDRKCDREFRKKRSIKRKQISRLADCMAAAWWRPRSDWKFDLEASNGGWELRFDPAIKLKLVPAKDGRTTIAAITLDEDAMVEGDPDPVGDVGSWPPPPPPPAPQFVAPTTLEASRIAGERAITPDDDTKIEILHSGKTRVVASLKLCVDVSGDVASVTQLKSSGFPAYDRKLEAGMKTWKYRPFLLNARPVPVCTAVMFIYQQQ
jgi:hypothetical protein